MTTIINQRNFYGRFKGRPLGLQKASLIKNLLDNVQVVIEADHQYHPQQFFDKEAPQYGKYVLEIGFGGGEHIANQAQNNPKEGFIGCEVFLNGVASLLDHIDNYKLKNSRIDNSIMQNLVPALIDQCLDRIYVMFPDPWPKFRHKKRQLINIEFLNRLSRVLKDDGIIYMASDDDNYVQSMLESIHQTAVLNTLKLICHTHQPPIDRPLTKYEQKAVDQNRICHYLSVSKSDNHAQ